MVEEKKNVLFVCTANELRSPTAEELFRKNKDIGVKSAGTSPFANQQIDRNIIDWSDLIIVMENHHMKKILEIVPSIEDKIVVLNIPDIYARNDPKLIQILKKKVPTHLNKLIQEKTKKNERKNRSQSS